MRVLSELGSEGWLTDEDLLARTPERLVENLEDVVRCAQEWECCDRFNQDHQRPEGDGDAAAAWRVLPREHFGSAEHERQWDEVYEEWDEPAGERLDRMGALVDEFERRSATTCERCGQPGELKLTRGWCKTLCPVCLGGRSSGVIGGVRERTPHRRPSPETAGVGGRGRGRSSSRLVPVRL